MESQERTNHTVKGEYWQRHINEWKASGLSQKQFCQSRSLGLSTFCYWKSRLNNPGPTTPKFYPLTIPAPPSNLNDAGLVLLIGSKKFQIHIKKGFSHTTLKKLIVTLEQL